MPPTEVHGVHRSGVSRGGEKTTGYARALRDYSLVTANWMQALVLEGRVFGATAGSVTTPITGAAYAVNRPSMWVRVPSGTTIMPLYANIAVEDSAGTDNEIWLQYCQNDIGNGTSTAATLGVLSYRSDAPLTSLCTARHSATGDTTAMTNPLEIKRWVYAFADSDTSPAKVLSWPEHAGVPLPILVGPASFVLWAAATTTAPNWFAQMAWAEFTSTDMT